MTDWIFELPEEISEFADQLLRLAAAEAHARRNYDVAVSKLVETKLAESGVAIGDMVQHVHIPLLGSLRVFRAVLEPAYSEAGKFKVVLVARSIHGASYFIPLEKAVKVGP